MRFRLLFVVTTLFLFVLFGATPKIADAFQPENDNHQTQANSLQSETTSLMNGSVMLTEEEPCQISYTSSDFTSNRFNNLPYGTLQLAIWYDGLDSEVETPILKVEYLDPSSETTGWLIIGEPDVSGGRISVFGHGIETREFDIGSCVLTGRFEVSDVIPNGVIDGLAFGLFARYADGTYDVMKSASPVATTGANFVGAWPLGLSDSVVAARSPQVTSGFGREQLRMMLYGAQYLDNGLYDLVQNFDEDEPQNGLCEISYSSSDFTSNRYNGLPEGTLQLAMWYDGLDSETESPILKVEYIDPATEMTDWLTIGEPDVFGGRIAVYGRRIETREFDIGGCVLTGRFEVSDVIPNGVIDGLAFGLLVRYADGTYNVMQSVSPIATTGANFVSAWPNGLSDSVVAERAPQLNSGFGREQLRMMLYGAQYLDNGLYNFVEGSTEADGTEPGDETDPGGGTTTFPPLDDFSCADVSEIPLNECEALVAISNANLDATFPIEWQRTDAPCGWTNVTCEDGHITVLGLSSSGLASLPPEIGNLNNLTSLDLDDNLLTSLPPEVSNLRNLTRLDLSNNSFTSVPTEVDNLPMLDSFLLEGNPLEPTAINLQDEPSLLGQGIFLPIVAR